MVLSITKVRRAKLLIYAAIAMWLCISFLFTPRLCGGDVQNADSYKIDRTEGAPRQPYQLKFGKDNNGTSGELIGQFIKGILFVGLLAVAVFFLSKKVLPKIAHKSGKNISVTETVQLGRNKTLHLVKINDNQTMLIGSTNENINLIADVTVSLLNDYGELTEEK
jgi:flagellar biogenesis protein FliO